jgi:leucyl/phenylalanyl-tRNA--protein transferase
MPRRSARSREKGFPYLTEDISFEFPPPETADSSGVLCTGGNLSPGLLLSAYRQGVVPWFNEGEPILWWSPDPRFVLFPEELHVSATMRKKLRRAFGGAGRQGASDAGAPTSDRGAPSNDRAPTAGGAQAAGGAAFELSLDRDFASVVRACSESPRPGQSGTWITEDMIEAYSELHRLGYAHSVELRREGELVGGLYGVSLGDVFFGESMFSRVDDASKLAFIPLAWRLADEGFTLIDSQVYTDHVASLGGREIPRDEYLRIIADRGSRATRKGDWGELFPLFPDSSEFRRVVPKEKR